MLDCLFISPDSSKEVYQGLADSYAAIEPQPWILMLSDALRKDGKTVAICDPLAERLNDYAVWARIDELQPRYLCFVVYGQNPNSGTTNMAGMVRLLRQGRGRHIPVIVIGSHASALPDETLDLDKPNYLVDYVLPGDGVNALKRVVNDEIKWRGVVWGEPCDASKLDYAWDLIDLKRYRCHTWHNNFGPDRSPFASIYTSLGCTFKCDFCMINLVNRSTPQQETAADSSGMRYLPTETVLRNIEYLANAGVRNVRIADEMFFLNRKHYLPILDGIISRGIMLNLWAYARVDSVRPEHLMLFKRAGFNWLCLGIESANQTIRREITKGSFEDVDVRKVAKEIKDAGINLLANFIFGLPDDSQESMQETLDLAMEINAEHTNFYPCMPLPGSPEYRRVTKHETGPSRSYSEYSFHSYDCRPSGTKHCSPKEVVAFRDAAWMATTLNPDYLALVAEKFGADRVTAIIEQTKIPLKRKLLES